MRYPAGATPLDPDELGGLRFKHITTREELNELEQANIESGLLWLGRHRGDVLTDDFAITLHKRLFGHVWDWAGTFRKTGKNIGVDPKPLPRYIAVDTVKDKRASPKAKKVVMVWDTHAENFVGNNIYDVENPPAIGSTTKFETYAAEYIGTGL